MAQTPISASVEVTSTTPTTIYTVPTGKTAIVKTVQASNYISEACVYTLNKVSNGTTYTVSNQISVANQAAANLLAGPITLSAGESVSISTTTSAKALIPVTQTEQNVTINNMDYLNNTYIAVGTDNSTGTGVVMTSANGITWVRQTFNFYAPLTNIKYGNGVWLATTSNIGEIYKSTNATTWTLVTHSGNGMNDLCYANNIWIAVGDDGSVIKSTNDGSSWATTTLLPVKLNAVSYVNSQWLIGTNYGSILSTTNTASAWKYPYSLMVYGAGYSFKSVSYHSPNSKFLAIVNSTAPVTGLYSSADGIYWTNVTNQNYTFSGTMRYMTSGYSYTTIYYASGIAYINDLNTSNSFTQTTPSVGSSTTVGFSSPRCPYSVNISTLGDFIGSAATFNITSNGNDNAGGWNTNIPASSCVRTACMTSGYTYYVPVVTSRNGINTIAVYSNYYGTSGALNSNYVTTYPYTTYGIPVASWEYENGSQCIFVTTTGHVFTCSDSGSSLTLSLLSRLPGGGTPVSMRYYLNKYVVLCSNGTVFTSTNGTLWTTVSNKPFGTFTDDKSLSADTELNTLVAINSTGQIYRSNDYGSSWSTVPFGITNKYNLNGTQYAAAGTVLYSTTDNANFTKLNFSVPAVSTAKNNAAYLDSAYYFTNNNSIITSSNLISSTTYTLDGKSFNTVNGFSGANIYCATNGADLALASSNNFTLADTFSNYLKVGTATAGILEIS